MSESYEVKCARCNVALQGPSVDPEPDDILSCPRCGVSDRFENVMREVEENIADQIEERLDATFEKATQGNDFVTFTKDRRPKKARRFVVDLKL